MISTIWGANGSLSSYLPDHPVRLVFFLIIVCLTAVYIVQNSRQFSRLTASQKIWLLGLSIGTTISTFFFYTFLPLPKETSPFKFTLFTAVPFLLAAVTLSSLPVFIVGFLTGLAFSLTLSGQLVEPFLFGFGAVAAHYLINIPYRGRVYHLLRNPIIVGILSMGLTTVLLAIAAYFRFYSENSLFALDQSTYIFGRTIWYRLFEGAVAGGIVWVILQWFPQIQPRVKQVLPPFEKSLRSRLMGELILFSTLLSFIVLTLVYFLSINSARRLVLNQMANTALLVSNDIPPFYNNLSVVTAALAEPEIMLEGTVIEQTERLEEIHKTSNIFSTVALVDETQSKIIPYPEGDGSVNFSPEERSELNKIFSTETFTQTAVTNQEGNAVSFIASIPNESGESGAAIVGRVDQLKMNNLIVGVNGVAGNSSGFILDENDQIIAHTNEGLLSNPWVLENGRSFDVSVNAGNGRALQIVEDNRRELVYILEQGDPDWTVVIKTPFSTTLSLASSIGVPLLIVLLAVTGLTALYMWTQTTQIIQPLNEMVLAANEMSQDKNWSPSAMLSIRQDEIGQLSRAFSKMQRAVKQRLSDLLLLLAVGQEVSHLDLKRGMPALLRGALRGTGASGARSAIINPSGGKPLSFGEGPLADEMAKLDRLIMSKLKKPAELILYSPKDIKRELGLEDTFKLPIQSLLAMSLHSHGRFQGIVWLGFSQPHTFAQSERKLLNTLGSQAAVMAGNAHLLASAESGRRRLYAVLASTREPVIVTDPTDRILIINPAFESLFGLKMAEVRNHRVQSIIKSDPLKSALIGKGEHHRNVEIGLEDGRTFYASASNIRGQGGQPFGRVVVLHDITYLKEIDELKSDFVQTVSHDLKNPLTFMSGFLAMIPMEGEVNEKQQHYIDKISNGIKQMTELVGNLLDLGRIEAGIDFNQEMIDLKPLLNSIADEYWQHAHMAGIKIKVDINGKLPKVRADLALLKQAITNLVGNGIKYAPDSGEMFLRAEKSNGNLIISIVDQGPGISEQDQIRLFEKFYRVNRPGTERIKGSGLGLAIVRSIAERHGGRAGCYSNPGEGATFYISLPFKKDETNQQPSLQQVTH